MIYNEKEVSKIISSTKIDTNIYKITADKKGMPNVLFMGERTKWYIHSSYDAVRDGESFALANYTGDSDLAVFGMGLGYHIKSLITKLAPQQKLYIFETNPSLLKIAFEATDLIHCFQNKNVCLYAGRSLLDLQKLLFACMYRGMAFTSYSPVTDTTPNDIFLIKKCHEIFTIHADTSIKPINIIDVKKNFCYKPLKRDRKYKILLIGYSLEGGQIDDFIKNLTLAFLYLGCETVSMPHEEFIRVLSVSQNSSILNSELSCDFMVSVDITYAGPSVDALGIPVVSIRIDRPYAISPHMRNDLKHVIYTWTDQSDLAYLGLYYPHGTHHFLPHGAELNAEQNNIFSRERVIDVVVSCSFHTTRVFESFAYANDRFDKELISKVMMRYERADKRIEDCVKDVMGEECDDETLYQFMHDIGFAIDIFYRLEKRYRVIKALVEGGVTVHLFGSGWEMTDITAHPNCIYHGAIQNEPGRLIFDQSKILINILPVHTGSMSHERVFSSMMHGVLCVTDDTKYLRDTFIENKEIVFFDYNNLKGLVEKVKYYLNHNEERLQITKNAFENVRANHTWINRAEEIINMYEEFAFSSKK